jgi:hypothetical protein
MVPASLRFAFPRLETANDRRHPSRTTAGLLATVFAGAGVLAIATPALALQSKAQQACINAVHKGFAAVAKAEAREAASCVKAAALGELMQPTVAGCIAADANGKIAAAASKATASIPDKCGEAPDFGAGDLTGAAAVAAAAGTRLEILQALFGDDLDATLVTKAADADGAACQAAVVKAVGKCWKARVAGYAKCASAGLETTINDAAALAECRDADADGKIAKACVADVQKTLDTKCEGVDLDARLPGCTCRYTLSCVKITLANATNDALSAAADLPAADPELPDVRVAQSPLVGPWISEAYGPYVASHVVGREPDAPLACPFGAVNIYTVQDPVADTAYNNGIVPLLMEQGVRVLYSNEGPVDLLGSSPANLVQGHQAMPLYGGASDFLHLATRYEVFALRDLKVGQVGDTLNFGFEQCLHDCEGIYASVFNPLNNPPFIFGTRLMIHHFSADRATIEGAVAGLAAEAELVPGVRLAWVGRTIADYKFELPDGSLAQAFHKLQADGSLVYQLDPGVDPVTDVLTLPALGAFMDATTSDAIMLVE